MGLQIAIYCKSNVFCSSPVYCVLRSGGKIDMQLRAIFSTPTFRFCRLLCSPCLSSGSLLCLPDERRRTISHLVWSEHDMSRNAGSREHCCRQFCGASSASPAGPTRLLQFRLRATTNAIMTALRVHGFCSEMLFSCHLQNTKGSSQHHIDYCAPHVHCSIGTKSCEMEGDIIWSHARRH